MSFLDEPLDDPNPAPPLRPPYTNVVELGLVVYHVLVCILATRWLLGQFSPMYFKMSIVVAILFILLLMVGLSWLHVDWIRLYWRWMTFSTAYDKGELATEATLDLPLFLLVRSALMIGAYIWWIWDHWGSWGINDGWGLFPLVLGIFLSGYEGWYWFQKQRLFKEISLPIRYV